MTKNLGSIDRAARIVIGLALLAFFFFGSQPSHWVGLIGVVPLATALIGWCPAYRVIGLSTCEVRRGPESRQGAKRA